MLTLILAESSIERVPSKISGHPSVVAHARRKGKKPSMLILDRSYHHSAMKALEDEDPYVRLDKRGRPDIVFHALLNVLGSPLNREGMLQTYVHTIEGRAIEIASSVRLPRNYDRYVGILEQLYEHHTVPLSGQPLLRIRRCSLADLVRDIGSTLTVAFSTVGTRMSMSDACSLILDSENPTAIIGGFAHSHFDQQTVRAAKYVFSIDKESLDAWTVAARLVYEYECGIGLPKKRLCT